MICLLHGKFWLYANKATGLGNSFLVLRNGYKSFPKEAHSIYAEAWGEILELLEDFHSCFETNRIFLPQDTATDIAKIYEKARADCKFLRPIENENEEARRKWLEAIEFSKINFSLEMCTTDMEKIYRSATEVISSGQ